MYYYVRFPPIESIFTKENQLYFCYVNFCFKFWEQRGCAIMSFWICKIQICKICMLQMHKEISTARRKWSYKVLKIWSTLFNDIRRVYSASRLRQCPDFCIANDIGTYLPSLQCKSVLIRTLSKMLMMVGSDMKKLFVSAIIYVLLIPLHSSKFSFDDFALIQRRIT